MDKIEMDKQTKFRWADRQTDRKTEIERSNSVVPPKLLRVRSRQKGKEKHRLFHQTKIELKLPLAINGKC